MRNTVIALVAGALVLAPAAGAAAVDLGPQAVIASIPGGSPEAPENETPQADAPAGSDPESAETGDAESQTPEADAPETANGRVAIEESAADIAEEGANTQASGPQKAAVSASVKISGTATVGKTLKVASSLKKPSDLAVTTVYTWYVNGKKAATGSSFKVREKDYKHPVHVTAVHTWAGDEAYEAGSKQATSAKTKKVVKQQAKVSTKVSITGTAKAGHTLTARPSTTKPKGIKASGTYTWYINGKRYGGGQKYKVQPRHAGASVKVVYTVKWTSNTYYWGTKQASSSKKIQVNKPARIVAGARAQLGVRQDCTALVEKALRNAGVKAGDLGTRTGEYTRLGGRVVGSPQPGDVLVWSGRHVAVYIGNGQAVHGGFNGSNTVIASWTILGKPQVVRFS